MFLHKILVRKWTAGVIIVLAQEVAK